MNTQILFLQDSKFLEITHQEITEVRAKRADV